MVSLPRSLSEGFDDGVGERDQIVSGMRTTSRSIPYSLVLLVTLMTGSVALGSPTNPDLMIAKSRSADRAGNRDAAIRLAESAIVADPARASSYVELGDLYMRAEQPDFAAFYYAEALEVDPLDVAVQQDLARADAAAKVSTATAAGSLDKVGSPH